MVGVIGANMHDLTGQRFGRLVCLSWESRQMTSRREIFWEVVCDCGAVKWVKSQSLKNGKTVSCGCLKNEKAGDRIRTHGLSKSPEYHVYKGIKKRCYNSSSKSYEDYGGRGIEVCDRWLEPNGQGFLNFLEDMGERPSTEHSIERNNVNGNYSPDNCYWTTKSQQCFNQRVPKSNKSTGILGITLERNGKYKVRISTGNERLYLGVYTSLEEALKVLQKAELKYRGMVRDRSNEEDLYEQRP